MKYKFSDYFTPSNIEALAISTGFMKRKAKKITPYNFILSFLNLYNTRTFSLRNWANELSNLTNETVTFQAVHKKLTIRHLPFLINVFSKILASNLKSQKSNSNELMSRFNRVLVEDSTCVKLANSMFDYFSGNSNGLCKKAILRIQICLDLKSGVLENCDMTTYTRNDGSYASEIIKRIEKDDLIIRDLGYWKVGTLKEIDDKEALFLSRLKHKNILYTSDNQRFKIVSFLKKQDRKGINDVQLNLEIGKGNSRVKVRVICKKINTNNYQKRLTRSKRSRHKNSKISQDSLYLLNWHLLITNIDEDIIKQDDIYALYNLRWEIEMFFKNWKSNYRIEKLLISPKGSDPIKPEMLMYLSLINMACIYQPNFSYYRDLVVKNYNKIVSPLKFAEFLKSIFKRKLNESTILIKVKEYCCYDKRKDRINMQQKLLNFGLG